MYFTVYIWLNEFAANIVLIGVLCYGGYLVLLERMTTDGIIAFLLYQVQLGENFYVTFLLIYSCLVVAISTLEYKLRFLGTDGRCRRFAKGV